ncbi:MAG: BspA family leucine-rich repeat surface protein, partial [Muribaculaceae bacterium]
SNVTDMADMFAYCYLLTTIYCDDTWTCDSSENMFYNCTYLVGAVPYDNSKVDVSMANPDTGYFTKPGASVTDINADESLAPTEIYNLQGIRMLKPLSDLPAGIYISGGRKVMSRR